MKNNNSLLIGIILCAIVLFVPGVGKVLLFLVLLALAALLYFSYKAKKNLQQDNKKQEQYYDNYYDSKQAFKEDNSDTFFDSESKSLGVIDANYSDIEEKKTQNKQ